MLQASTTHFNKKILLAWKIILSRNRELPCKHWLYVAIRRMPR